MEYKHFLSRFSLLLIFYITHCLSSSFIVYTQLPSQSYQHYAVSEIILSYTFLNIHYVGII